MEGAAMTFSDLPKSQQRALIDMVYHGCLHGVASGWEVGPRHARRHHAHCAVEALARMRLCCIYHSHERGATTAFPTPDGIAVITAFLDEANALLAGRPQP